ncbi:Peramine synthetase, partial [Frankliniella fusca]
YTELWSFILSEADKIRSFICPHVILFDFELSAHNAIRLVPVLRVAFDQKPVKGEEHEERDPEREWLLRFLGLSCLDHYLVPEAVAELERVMPTGPDYRTFLKYVNDTYTGPKARYPPSVWASVSTMEPATTNGAEAFHADFNAQFNSSHPNIFASISILQQVSAQTYLKINSIKNMESNYIRPKRIELKERRLTAWQEVLNGERTVSSYLLYMGSLNAGMNKKK